MFDALQRELPSDLRIIKLDLRGHGQSETPRKPYSVADLAADLTTAMDTLGIAQPVLVGHSLGGMAVLAAALAHPERIAALVLIGSSAQEEGLARKRQLDQLALTLRITGVRPWLVRFASEAFFNPGFRRRRPEVVAAWCRQVRVMEKSAALHALTAVKERPRVMEQLNHLAAPSLILCGAEDMIADPDHSAAMARRLPNGTLAIVPDAGHALPYEQPRELAVIMTRFLTQHGLARAVGRAAP
jgi:pimeloyl-ACP methyl ester carboxylesterase